MNRTAPELRPARLVVAAALAVSLFAPSLRADTVVVFTELMYHPATDEAANEWVELHSQMAVDVDISGWSLTGGIDFAFPEGTIIPGGGYIVVGSDPTSLADVVDPEALFGPYLGRLDNGGERIDLVAVGGRVMDSVRYFDAGRWPVSPDGSGTSLARIDPGSVREGPQYWRASEQIGGTPGAVNFPDETPAGPGFPAGLVAYWALDGDGSDVTDPVGANTGTRGSTTDRVAGLVGAGALAFDDSVDAFVNVGAGSSFDVRDGITIEALFVLEWSGAVDDQDMIFRKEDGSDRIVLGFQNDGNDDGRSNPPLAAAGPVLSFGLNVDGEYSELDILLDGENGRPTLAELKDGTAHHIAATYDSTSGAKIVYLDGAEIARVDLRAGAKVTSGGATSAYLGNMSGRRQAFTGTLDEIAFWNRAIGAATVASHAARAAAGEDYFSTERAPIESTPLAINEIQPGVGASWVELVNLGAAPIDLEGFVLATSADGAAPFEFGAETILPGGYLVVDEVELGFALVPPDKLFLYSADRAGVVDAAAIRETLRARSPEGTGRFFLPNEPSPGEENRFAFRDDIVINEIHYHPRPEPAKPPVFDESILLGIESVWRYDASGDPQPSTWKDASFDHGDWPFGPALIYRESSDLPAPKNTEIELGPTTFYFRREFEFTDELEGAVLRIRHVIDDGAVFYLNGAEVLRFNMPTGAFDETTRASPAVSNAVFVGPVAIDTSALVRGTNVLAVEVHQSTTASSDVVFGLELYAGVLVDPGHPFRESPDSWLELYNNSDQAVDLTGWRLDRGINFDFPPGTSIAARDYLVVAEDAERFAGRHPGVTVVGDFTGTLSNASDVVELEDANRNPVDEVEYFDDGYWPHLADGGGSSLELRNPNADNRRAEAWAASDETERMGWKQYRYRKVAAANVGPTQWREFVVGLLEAGEILVDDIRVVEEPDGANRSLLQNGTFSSGATAWRIIGNHRHSRVVPDPDDPSNEVLHIVATGPTEHMHNHLETTLRDGIAVQNGREYEISFRARWLAGSNQLNTRLYFNRSPLTTLVEVPDTAGTPGRENSVFEANLGPTFTSFGHAPAVPGSGSPVQVSVEAADPDGVASVDLWYRVDTGGWQRVAMAASGSTYRATIPGQSASRLVQFYVEGEDTRGATATFPAAGRDSRALYRVNDGQSRGGAPHNFRILMTSAETSFMHNDLNVMSNERLGGTVIYRESEAFYDVGVRLKGSERGRPGGARVSFSARFHRAKPFRGLHRSVSLDRSGGWGIGNGPTGQDEIIFKHLVNAAGNLPSMYDDIGWLIAPRSAQTGHTLFQMAKYNSDFLDSMYADGSDGIVYKMELIYHPTTTTDGDPESPKRPLPDGVIGTDLRNLGGDKEAYRYNFILESQRTRDSYDRLMELAQVMGSSGSSFLNRIEGLLDTDEAIRMYVAHSLVGANDTYILGSNAHNLMWYMRPEDERFVLFAWDQDFAWSRSSSHALWGGENLSKLFSAVPYQRVFYGHLHDMLETTYNRPYMQHWINHYGTMVGELSTFNRIYDYIGARHNFARGRLPSEVDFQITTNGGNPMTVDEPTVTLAGDGWVNIRAIAVDGHEDALDLEWTGMTDWRAEIPLQTGVNELALLAFDYSGEFIALDTIDVTSTFEFPEPVLTSLDPGSGPPTSAATLTGENFEPSSNVLFGGIAAEEILFVSPTRLEVKVPRISAGVVDVVVMSSAGVSSNALPFTVETSSFFIRGDANLDLGVDISDALTILLHLFEDKSVTCLDALDANDDEGANIADALYVLNYLFGDGPPPPEPTADIGLDPTGDGSLDCATGVEFGG